MVARGDGLALDVDSKGVDGFVRHGQPARDRKAPVRLGEVLEMATGERYRRTAFLQTGAHSARE